MADRFSMQGKVAVVTGALGLLGQKHVEALAEAGASVVLTDADERVIQVAGDLGKRTGAPHFGWPANVCNAEDLEHLLREVLGRFDRLDVLVNNAAVNDRVEGRGRAGAVPFEELPVSDWQRLIDVNVTGVFLCCQILGAEMARRGHGSIINVASTYGVVAPDQSLYRDDTGRQTMFKSAAYATSKGAVIAFTRYLAAYWGSRGVRVNALSPGGVENGQDAGFVARYAKRTPLGRMANAGDYQGALVFLASDAATYLTGANLVVDGGFTIW